MDQQVVVKAFKITEIPRWLSDTLGGEPSAACTLVCESGHTLSVNDAWASVYSPQVGGWLLVNRQGKPVYRSDEEFQKIATHIQNNFYHVPRGGDFTGE
jgi:hypothetical protein